MSDDDVEEGAENASEDPRRWQADGWTARVIKNEDDDGWAVEMTADGQTEPSLVGPWTMGRDKKNPKPIDSFAFATMVKTANEILARHVQQLRAKMHRNVNVRGEDGARLRVDFDVVADEDDPHATITVHDEAGAIVAQGRVSAGFKLTAESARRWIDQGGESEP